MQRLDILPWEANHPLNGYPCPVTGRLIYIENRWKVSRPDYRLRTGILEHGVVLSLPVGYTKINDTAAFFEIMHMICNSAHIDSKRFVLIEDYTFHTGSDFEGRSTYIKRMIDEIHPLGIVFITRATSWKLSIKFGTVLYGSPFPIKSVSSYRQALQEASDILGRPLAGSSVIRTHDKIDYLHFAVTANVLAPSLVQVVYSGFPLPQDLSSIADFYMGLPDHPKVIGDFRIIHDFSSMVVPPVDTLYKLLRMVMSKHCNNGGSVNIIKGESPVFKIMTAFLSWLNKGHVSVKLYNDCKDAISEMQSKADAGIDQSDKIQMAAMEMLETIAWDKPGYYELEVIQDPLLKPLSLMLGAIKQDVDYYLKQREMELEKLQEANTRARELSFDIDRALQRSEQDRKKAEVLSNENISLSLEIARAQKEVFLVLSDYIDQRAHLQMGSTKKLAQFVSRLAELFGYTSEECSRLHDATLLYHVGYLGVSEQEQNQELHCIVGCEVLSNIYTFIMQYAAHIARYHHEKWDGTGYPDHLIGEKIPREAQLIAIAEFILSCSESEILNSLKDQAGKVFDPAMVETIVAHKKDVLAYLTALRPDK